MYSATMSQSSEEAASFGNELTKTRKEAELAMFCVRGWGGGVQALEWNFQRQGR